MLLKKGFIEGIKILVLWLAGYTIYGLLRGKSLEVLWIAPRMWVVVLAVATLAGVRAVHLTKREEQANQGKMKTAD